MKIFARPHSPVHVLLAHALVLLLFLTPTTQAGDILRMSAPAAGAATAPGAAASDAAVINTAAATAQARTNAQDMLARNTMALQAVTAMQEAARAAAAGMNNLGANPNFPGQTLPDVPDGLGAGGLQIIGAPVGANAPQQSLENARTIVTIQQTQQQALLEWQTFNVGANTTLRFDQSAGGADVGTWIAFNRVTDPTGNPTQILGSIEAQGQVYVINQNGIIFGGASVVNTHTLVAAALPVNENLIARGLLNNPDSQFLFSTSDLNAQAAVAVQAGARLTAPTSAANVGGRVALIGPVVTNRGTISTPDGQTILAAGLEVGFDAHSTDDPSLRGLDVFVGRVGAFGGAATNDGLIEAPRGSVVITGKTVSQNGFINSTTSAALNGRVDLLANYNAVPNTNYNAADPSFGRPFVYQSGNSTGIVSTGVGSVIQILPEYASALKVVGTELALKSQINMQGLGVHLGMNSVVLAPNANVALSAGVWDLVLTTGTTDLDFAHSSGQVYVDQGAVINVAGSTAVAASISEYIITVDLRGAELADSALQRNGSLRGQSVTVDLREHGTREDGTTWVGTPLANLQGYLGVIERNVGQLTVAGGMVTMQAGESVIVQTGAEINVSGGYQDFGGGLVETTRLLHEGNLVDIADARADIIYQGVYNPIFSASDTRWGTTSGSTTLFAAAGHYEDAHSVGAGGGALTIRSAAMALDGGLVGHTITGPQQLPAAPQLSILELNFRAQQLSRNPLELPFYSPTPPNIEVRSGASGLPTADAFALSGGGAPVALRVERQNALVLSPALLTTQGFGRLFVDNSDGNITVPAGVTLAAPLAGAITLHGANVDIQGTLSAPAGTIDLKAHTISPYTTTLLEAQGVAVVIPPANPARGRVTLGTAALLSTAGAVLDDRVGSPTRLLVPQEVLLDHVDGSTSHLSTTRGGSISIDGYIAELAAGSVLDVSGGFAIDQNGGVTYADAGAITLKAGRDPALDSLLGGRLSLGAVLRGFSGAGGGDLALLAPMIQIGGVAPHADALVLAPEFFNQGGFDSFHLTGLGIDVTPPAGAEAFLPGVLITAGSVIQPQVRSLQATIEPQGGLNPVSVSTLLKPEGYRPATSLLFEAPGVTDFVSNDLVIRGAVVAELGSSIETDALGSVAFQAQTVELLGNVLAPGGTISVTGAASYPQNSVPTTAFATVHLGAASRLSTAGKTVLLQDPYGRRTGTVHDGGTISVSGNLVADTGAVLDVSGTSSVLDLLPLQAGTLDVFNAGLSMAALFPGTAVTQPVQQAQAVPTRVDSHGGGITLHGGDFLFSNATLIGQAGGSTASGGSLTVRSDRFIPSGGNDDAKDITLLVAQNMAAFTQPVFTGGQVIGKALLNGGGGALQNIGYFGADSFTSGGFDALTLAGNVRFVGPVDVTAAASLHVADGGVLAANDLVRLTATYIALGQPLAQPTRDEELINPFLLVVPGTGIVPSVFSPTTGSGRLEVTADLLETGFLSLQNIGQTNLTARQELRGSGYFDVAGDLTITAGQIYPVAASTFTITAYNGTVTLASFGSTPPLPLSGGGRLSIYANTIIQGGVLRAPLGTITLGWDGSGTAPKGLVTNASVPVTQQITLQSGGITSVSAIDPLTGTGLRIPYGLIKDGTNWIDPTGFDITGVGAPDKTIKIAAQNVATLAGSSIDIRGGGELYGYRWVEGNGGTKDILDTSASYAILPGYSSAFAPFAPFATVGLNAGNLGGDPGYANSTLAVGDRVFLQAAPGLAAGVYTLLPARYALLPGAMLVTPDTAGTLTTAQVKPGGAVLTSGYVFNSLNPAVSGSIHQQFEVAALSVVKARAEYTDHTANAFIPAAQQRLSLPVSFTASDAGYALLNALQTMQLGGGLMAGGFQAGRGGRVDVSSPVDIVLAAPGAPAQPGKLLLNTTLLSDWNAESLLIGGVRTFGTESTSVTVRTGNLTLDNAGAPLTGKEIILAATGTITLAANAALTQSGAQSVADSLIVGGNGALVRVSGVAAAQTARTGVTTSALPQLSIGAGVQISGPGITLDSTNATALDPTASFTGQALNLNSGRVSIQLDNPGALQPDAGLVLGGTILTNLQASTALSLLSYSSIDIYGTGTLAAAGSLALHAAEIRGFNQAGGTVNINAQSILLDNSANGALVGAVTPLSGTLSLTAATITLGVNALQVSQYSTVDLNAASGITVQSTGSFKAQGAVNAVTPFFTAANNASHSLTANGALALMRPMTVPVLPASIGLGAKLAFEGTTITADTDVLLPSGLISLNALTGNLSVSGRIDAGGTARGFFDQTRYTNAGQVSLSATLGSVTLDTGSVVNVAAAAAGGDAGLLIIKAGSGALNLNGTLLGQAGAGGQAGSAEIDVGSLASFAALNTALANGTFTNSLNLRLRSGSVTIDGTVNAHRFLLGVDQGSITVNGTINASGTTGGRIDLIASGSVVVASGALLTVAAQNFDNAGKGGAIWLEAGSYVNNTINTAAVLDVRDGSTLNLSVAAHNATSAQHGRFTGTLHLRAPQTVAGNEVTAIQAIGGSILNASHIAVEGYKIYDLTGSGDISTTVQGNVNSNGVSFGGNSAAITTRLLTGNVDAAALSPLLVVMPGAEIVNRTGGLMLGTTTSAAAGDWNLATFRYGPNNAPGVLTLRAAGNLEFYNTLSDGFTVPVSGNAVERMWLATLTALNTLTPVNAQSWSYRMAAGADFSAANFRQVLPLAGLGANTGSLLLGKDAGQAIPTSVQPSNPSPGDNALTRLAINPTNGTNASTASNRFQVIRTGTGDIEIITGRDVQLLNQFATIYTAGVSVPSATTVFAAGDFVLPVTSGTPPQTGLGAVQQIYPAQYSMAGGNVAVTAGADIVHLTRDTLGALIADSSRELPNNWLMRRGYVDGSGQYGTINVQGGSILQRINDAAASTTWWVNFSNFFDGVAALGGGNVTLKAGRDVQNVSAHAPTNARAARGTPDAATLLELGGGDVTVIAGRNIDGGIYYVERGSGSLQAGGQVTTNSTRSPSLGLLGAAASIHPADTWLPTTLFVGKSSFSVSARGDVLLGPVANTFLMPQGVNNKHWYKTYFSTYAPDSGVTVTSLGGSITFRQAATQPFASTPESILGLWMKNELLLTSGSAASYQPWLRLAESNVDPFFTLATLMPGSLRAVAWSGDINLVGRMNLSPSATGTIDLLAAGAVNGLRPTGVSTSIIPAAQTSVWSSTTLNLSDANPPALPGALSPYAYYQVYYNPAVSNNNNDARVTGSTFLNVIDSTFAESGSTTGAYASTQVKQQLHAAGLLHLNDTSPVRIYAAGGDLSGLTLFAGKPAVILAQRDITDIALYVQNLRQSDVSIVSSGRDIVAYNANSILRSQAASTGNLTAFGEVPKSGDIQINGPGTLQVLAGRNLNLGTGSNNADGTGVGITSIGNGRNPGLPFAGAGIVIGAGMGAAAAGLGGTNLDFTGFINDFASSPAGDRYLMELAEILDVPSVDLSDPLLTPEQQRQLALAVFYLVLRDAGRDHNDPDSPNAGTYTEGFAAIAKLFPATSGGSIETQARDIRTKSGGDISLLAPAGGLQLASTLIGSTLAPPGVITEAGGNVSIFTHESVDIGIARIFTLRGGDIMIWSSTGDIAAGSSSKTVQSAPPTRVLIDPQSANVATDLAGLATGGGIGVLATVAGVRPGNVDLIAPVGAVDAGDAGIRATGNLNIAATIVLNAANISVGGTSAGTPAAATVASPSLGAVSGANSSAGAATSATAQTGAQPQTQETTTQSLPSIITVEVIGYGGGSGDDDEERKRNQPGE